MPRSLNLAGIITPDGLEILTGCECRWGSRSVLVGRVMIWGPPECQERALQGLLLRDRFIGACGEHRGRLWAPYAAEVAGLYELHGNRWDRGWF
jgi:hypothetical protein